MVVRHIGVVEGGPVVSGRARCECCAVDLHQRCAAIRSFISTWLPHANRGSYWIGKVEWKEGALLVLDTANAGINKACAPWPRGLDFGGQGGAERAL